MSPKLTPKILRYQQFADIAVGAGNIIISNPLTLNPDAIATLKNVAMTFSPCANDTSDVGPVHLSAVGTPSHGTAVRVGVTDNITYTPSSGYIGADSFSYDATDGVDTATGLVSVVVADTVGVTAIDDVFSINDNAQHFLDVLANDLPAATVKVVSSISTQPTKGTAAVRADGSGINYTRQAGVTGNDFLDYVVSGGATTDTGRAAIVLGGGNTPYPLSTLYKQLILTGAARSYGVGADQWVMTTYPDGSLLGAAGDGNGWAGGAGRQAMFTSQISGAPSALTGVDRYLGGLSPNRKPNALLHIGSSTVLGWFVNDTLDNRVGTYAAISTDGGTTWTFSEATANRIFSTAATPPLQIVGAIQLDTGYTGGPTGFDRNYAYLYLNKRGNISNPFLPDGTNGTVWGCRVKIAGSGGAPANIIDPTKYSFFNGLDGSGQPTWTANGGALDLTKTIYVDPSGMGKHFRCDWSVVNSRFFAAVTPTANKLAVYESVSPFGGWSTLFYGAGSDGDWTNIFSAQVPGVWTATDKLWLAVSGNPPDDLEVQSSPLGLIIGPPPVPKILVTQLPIDLQPSASLVKTEPLVATRSGDLSSPSRADWAVAAGGAPAVDGTDFGLAAGIFPTGRFDFAAGIDTATSSFQVAAKAPPAADENAVFNLTLVTNLTTDGPLSSLFKLLHGSVTVVEPITDIRQDSTKVFWTYTQPPTFTGYEIRTTTIKGRGWAQSTVLVASQTAKQILKSAIPSGVKEVLVKPTIAGGQQADVPARIDITGVVTKDYPSGLQWLSGLNPEGDVGTGGVQMSDAFATWRGRANDCWNVKGKRTGTWAELVSSIKKTSSYQAAWDRHIRIEQNVPMIPAKPGSDDLNACGATDANSSSVRAFIAYHTEMANWVAAQQIRRPYIIRLGHELEDTGNAYSPAKDSDQTNYSHYLNCMKRAGDIWHTALGGPPDFYIDQCHLRTGMDNIAWDKYFPGSEYVDIGGLDAYCTLADAYTKPNTSRINSARDMTKYLDANLSAGHPRGPRAAADWCIARNIKFGIGEWGITTPNGYPGYTDGAPGNPNDVAGSWYNEAMYDFFLAYQDTLIYEAYFSVNDDPKDHRIVDYNTRTKVCTDLAKAPAAAAAYRLRWTP